MTTSISCRSCGATADVAARAELERLATHDPLTGLANRQRFCSELVRTIGRCDDGVAVLFIDLDDFKTVNDTLGHAVGDELLERVAGRLASATRIDDLVARFGGDEFAVLLADVRPSDAFAAAQRILGGLREPFALRGRRLTVRASAGLAVHRPGDPAGVAVDASGADDLAAELLRQADIAMYAGKGRPTTTVTLFQEGLHSAMLDRLSLESDLADAVETDQFSMQYQPIVHLATGRVEAVEALMRWTHPERGSVPPVEFVPVAEQTGLIVPLTMRALHTSLAQLKLWDAAPATAGLSMAVNISARVVSEPGVGSAVARELHASGISPDRVVLEITESLLMEDRHEAVQALCQLRALGMRLSIDDFGTGYSSLSRLVSLPIDEVKIDRSFISELAVDQRGRTVVTAAIAMAHGLGLRVVAEGVESPDQLAFLRTVGCDDGQGYWFGRPSDACDVAAAVARHRALDPTAVLHGVPRPRGRAVAMPRGA